MPTVKIPLTKGVYKNVEGEELTDYDALLVDCYIDEMGYCHKRPGLATFVDLTSTLGSSIYPINGIFWWKNLAVAIAVAYGKVIKISHTLGNTSVTDLSSSLLSLNQITTFTTDGTNAFLANGGRIVYTNGTALTSYIADADCPTTVTHVDWIDGYLLAAGDGTNKFYWSDVNAPLSWNALNYASASGNADPILALKVFQRQILLFGSSSLEVWENDGVNPFSRISSGFFNVGTIAPYSVVMSDQSIYWLSDTRRVVRFRAGVLESASTPFDKEIANYSSVSDCVGFRSIIGGRNFLIFDFPGANKTLVYSELEDRWHEWGSWDTSKGERNKWLGGCSVWVPDWGIHLVGDSNTGLLYAMGQAYFSDNGNPIRVQRRTGFIDYGNLRIKRSEQVRLRAKRGVGGISRTPKIAIRWNDGKTWSNEKFLSLGDEGESGLVMRIDRLGMFRTRQYEIIATDDVPVVFGDAEEDITILR